MIIPIRCFTCGKTLADKYDWYVDKVAEMRSQSESASKTTYLAHFDPIHTAKLLDQLGLTRTCCRRHMIGEVDMTDKI